MAWVKRDGQGNIVGMQGAAPNVSEGITEEVADNNSELLAFLNPAVTPVINISRRQFYTALALAGNITQAEALAAMAGNELPAALETIVAAIPDDVQSFIARGLLLSATDFKRNHPLVSQIGAAQGQTEEQIDTFFTAAAQL